MTDRGTTTTHPVLLTTAVVGALLLPADVPEGQMRSGMGRPVAKARRCVPYINEDRGPTRSAPERETMGHASWTRIGLSAVVIAMLTILGGCTAIRRDHAPETTSLLTQAGFKVLKADTPERVAKLNTLTPYKVVPWKRKTGGTVYAYAEPDLCQCVYVGSPQQYATYRKLLSAEQAARIAAQEEAWANEPEEFSDSTIEE
jgi:hypothetical protein